MCRALLLTLLVLAPAPVALRAGEVSPKAVLQPAPPEDWRRPEFAFETGLGFGLNNPGDYQTAPQLLTFRHALLRPFRLGDYQLLHQVSVNVAAVPFYHDRRGYHDNGHAESFYFGGGVGARFVMSRTAGFLSAILTARDRRSGRGRT